MQNSIRPSSETSDTLFHKASSGWRRLKRTATGVLAFSMVAAGLLATQEAAAVTCTPGGVYATGYDGRLTQVNPATGSETLIGNWKDQPTNPYWNVVNGLGVLDGIAYGVSVGQHGNLASTTPQIWRYDASTGTKTSYPGTTIASTGVMAAADYGAINPVTGIYYYGWPVSSTVFHVYAFNTKTNTAFPGLVAAITYPSFDGFHSGLSGDMDFDASGRLYIAVTTGATWTGNSNPLYVVNGTLPTTAAASPVVLTATIATYLKPSDFAYGGMVIDKASGDIVAVGGKVFQDPYNIVPNVIARLSRTTGAVLSTAPYTGTAGDLAGCSLSAAPAAVIAGAVTPNPTTGPVTVSGTVNRPDATVTVRNPDSSLLCTTSSLNPAADNSFSWVCGGTVTGPDGPKILGVSMTTPAGESASTTASVIKISPTSAPFAIVSATAAPNPTTGPVHVSGTTNRPGVAIVVKNSNGSTLCTTTGSSSLAYGAYAFACAGTLPAPDGTKTLTVKATAADGSMASAHVTVTLKTRKW